MRRPEILAPAGDRDALTAALAAGADAVYFGLDDGFNARARAANFPSHALAEVALLCHRAGAKAFVTLNTLVFEPELPVVEELIRRAAAANIDAIIVQDPAVALLARAICPQLEVHGSTQMTASSPLAASLLAPLGLTRIVAPRELSLDEIRAYAQASPIPLEVFIHGALCVAWSGQCLSSEAWGGRSANRGQCAQACRLPYRLVVDDHERDLGDVEYLLSPKDLVGSDAVRALAEANVASLKIEGRLKGPHYVATTVAHYRAAAAIAVGEPPPTRPIEIAIDDASLAIAYSRGGSRGFLNGADHQTLVEGRFPRHRGLPLGRVSRVDGDAVYVEPDATTRPDAPRIEPRAGMGVVFDRGRPEEPEEGGPIFAVDHVSDIARELGGTSRARSSKVGGSKEVSADAMRLVFGRPGPDLSNVHVGDIVWISSDPRITRTGDKAAEAGRLPLGRIGVDMLVRGAVGGPLEVIATLAHGAPSTAANIATTPAMSHSRAEARATTSSNLAAARGAGLTREMLADKLGSFGGTPFHLGSLAVELDGALHVPVSELKEVRRSIVKELDAAIARVDRVVEQASVIDRVRTQVDHRVGEPHVVPLCRTDAQLDAVLDLGVDEVELDWMELVGLAKAVERARKRGVKRVGVATVRVQKPGEDKIDAHLARLDPDHVLVRSWGSLAYFRGLDTRPALHGDFSLNVTNSITAGWVLAHGLETITAAHDLDRDQLMAMLENTPRGRVAVTVHHHIPTFHTEHCVYAHLLSEGKDFRTCGRPCEQHQVALRDRVGLVHPVVVDVGCRNTVFNAQAQSAAAIVPDLLARGVTRMRVELVRESAAETTRVVDAYRALARGAIGPSEVVKRAAVHEQFGVTRGTMRTLAVLR